MTNSKRHEEDSTQFDGPLYYELAELVSSSDTFNNKEAYYWKTIKLDIINDLTRI